MSKCGNALSDPGANRVNTLIELHRMHRSLAVGVARGNTCNHAAAQQRAARVTTVCNRGLSMYLDRLSREFIHNLSSCALLAHGAGARRIVQAKAYGRARIARMRSSRTWGECEGGYTGDGCAELHYAHVGRDIWAASSNIAGVGRLRCDRVKHQVRRVIQQRQLVRAVDNFSYARVKSKNRSVHDAMCGREHHVPGDEGSGAKTLVVTAGIPNGQ